MKSHLVRVARLRSVSPGAIHLFLGLGFVGLVSSQSSGGVDEATFHLTLDKLEALYSPEAKALGKTLVVDRLWKSSRVEAKATNTGRNWQITLHGGLARHPELNADGFAHVVCHELGHHFGGAPRIAAGITSEGQADYFATLKCLRRLFAQDPPLADDSVPNSVRAACGKAHEDKVQAHLCERSVLAALNVGRFNAAFWPRRVPLPPPQIETPEIHVAPHTLPGYGTVQCRLDTSFQGALCGRRVDEKLSFTDPRAGTCNAGPHGSAIGARPRCWYRGDG